MIWSTESLVFVTLPKSVGRIGCKMIVLVAKFGKNIHGVFGHADSEVLQCAIACRPALENIGGFPLHNMVHYEPDQSV